MVIIADFWMAGKWLSQLSPASAPNTPYRTGVVFGDGTQILASTFKNGTIPVIPVTGLPNLAISARTTNQGDSIGVTLVALSIDSAGNVSVLWLAPEVTLTSRALTDAAGKFLSSAWLASGLGARGALALAAGPVTHVAWFVSTAPTANRPVDLYQGAWS